MARQSKKRAFEDAQAQSMASSICVADIVKVVAFDEANMTVDVQPITRYPDEDSFQTKPQVLAVPVAMIYGGGWAFRPVYQAGDIGVVLYPLHGDHRRECLLLHDQERHRHQGECDHNREPDHHRRRGQSELRKEGLSYAWSRQTE